MASVGAKNPTQNCPAKAESPITYVNGCLSNWKTVAFSLSSSITKSKKILLIINQVFSY